MMPHEDNREKNQEFEVEEKIQKSVGSTTRTCMEKETSVEDEPGASAEGTSAGSAEDEPEIDLKMAHINTARTERKRNREKQRRSDVNKGLDQLIYLVFAIDPQLKKEAEERAKKNPHGGRSLTADNALLSRVELLNCAVATLQHVHQENEERKMVIARLAEGLLGRKGNGAAPSHSGLPPSSLANSSQRFNMEAFLSESEGLGVGASASRGPATLVHPEIDRNPAEAAFLRGFSSLPNDCDTLGGGNAALYRAILNQRIQEEKSAALVGSGFLGAGACPLGRMPSVPNDSLSQSMMREQAIVQVAAARGFQSGGLDDSPSAKRFRRWV